jgi:hypothetical protein
VPDWLWDWLNSDVSYTALIVFSVATNVLDRIGGYRHNHRRK